MIKSQEIIPIKHDLLFKKIFGDNNHIQNLEEFLSIYFNCPVEEVRGNVKVINGEKRILNKNSKRQNVDVVAEVNLAVGKKIINIEINLYEGTTFKRNVLYVTGLVSNQMRNKQNYNNVIPVIQISFDSYDINKNNPRIIKRCFLKDETNTILSDVFEIDHILIDKCYEAWYNKTINEYDALDRGLILLGALISINDTNELKRCLGETTMSKETKDDILSEALEYSEEFMNFIYYDKELDDWKIREGDKELAHDQGLAEGKEIGKKETSLEIAKKLLEKDMDITSISEITGLSESELATINNS